MIHAVHGQTAPFSLFHVKHPYGHVNALASEYDHLNQARLNQDQQ